MPDIFHHFPINASPEEVFHIISTPEGLDKWWSNKASGHPALEQTFQLNFGPLYNWSAVVSKYEVNHEFELILVDADEDWINSKVGFKLETQNNSTVVQFYHTGWKTVNDHFKISSFCWAMYLRIMKRHLEFGELIPYEMRLSV